MRNPNLSQHPYPVKLRELMEKKEISNETLAEKVNVTPQYIQMLKTRGS